MQSFTSRAAAALLASSTLVFAQWTQKLPATSPTARVGAAMTFDGTLGSVLLFGGSAGLLSNQTWTYSGTDWLQLFPAASPSARFGAQMVYDSARSVTVLYGGLDSPISIPPPKNDTWEFDGTTWTQATPAANAGNRYHYGACYDSVRSRMVIYGGSSTQLLGVPNSQTWEYEGTAWALIATAGNPGPRNRPAMCFHAGLGKAVMFGGYNGANNTDQTWLYDGVAGTWTQVAITGTKPPARNAATMVYDSVRGLCVLTGGQDTAVLPFADTWTFDGATWTQQPTTTQGVRDHSMAFAPSLGQAVKFGGFVSGPNVLSNQTWEFGSGIFGAGCPGTGGVPALSASTAPLLGQSYTLTVNNLHPALNIAFFVFGFTQLPGIDLSSLPMPGCFLYTTLDIIIGVSGAAGSASWTWPVVTGNVGDAFYCQTFCLDTVNGFGFTVSNPIFATVGG